MCFNPCFNGTYSLTYFAMSAAYLPGCFNPCFNGTYSLTDDFFCIKKSSTFSFNPCFNGTYSLTSIMPNNTTVTIPF